VANIPAAESIEFDTHRQAGMRGLSRPHFNVMICLACIGFTMASPAKSAKYGGEHDSTVVIPAGNHSLSGRLVINAGGRLLVQPGANISFRQRASVIIQDGATLQADSALFFSEKRGRNRNGGGFIVTGADAVARFVNCRFFDLGGRWQNWPGKTDTAQALLVKEGALAVLVGTKFRGESDTDDMLKVMSGSTLSLDQVHVESTNHGSALFAEGPGTQVEIRNSILETGVSETQNHCVEVTNGAVVHFLGRRNQVINSKQARIRQWNTGLIKCRNVWWGAYPINNTRHLGPYDDESCVEWEPALSEPPKK
jgi:hypothetical protein